MSLPIDMRLAAEQAHQAQLTMGHDPKQSLSRNELALFGRGILAIVGTQDSDTAVLNTLHNRRWKMTEDQLFVISTMVAKPSDQMILLGSYRWAHSAFPQVVMGHKYAAALMATSITESMKSDILLPCPAFIILVPPGLIRCKNDQGTATCEVQHIVVTQIRYEDGSPPGIGVIVCTVMASWPVGGRPVRSGHG
jgi:hypothetical protein